MLDSLFDLESLGWDDFFRSSFQSENRVGCIPGRVVQEHRGSYQIFTERGELWSSLSGRLRHKSSRRDQLPAAGDWVVIRRLYDESSAAIVAVLPRKSQFIRGAAGDKTEAQVIAANIDTVFLMMAVNRDFNLRRIERYLVMACGSGAQPVVVLSKSDLCADAGHKALELETVSMGAPIHVVSVLKETGLGAVRRYFAPGKTVALLGSSGVGKSTLINYLLSEEVQKTQELRRRETVVVLGANAYTDLAEGRCDHVRPRLAAKEIGFGASRHLLPHAPGLLAGR